MSTTHDPTDRRGATPPTGVPVPDAAAGGYRHADANPQGRRLADAAPAQRVRQLSDEMIKVGKWGIGLGEVTLSFRKRP